MRSRGVDLYAVTAMETLRGSLGYGNAIETLARADLWGVWTNAEGEELRRLSEHLVGDTSVFINPNKHSWRVWEGGGDDDEQPCDGAWALVWALEDVDGRAALAALRSSGFGKRVEWVAKGTLWTLKAAPSARDMELELVEQMTVATHRNRGLLANPHIHRWSCGLGNLSLNWALDKLGLAGKEAKVPSVS